MKRLPRRGRRAVWTAALALLCALPAGLSQLGHWVHGGMRSDEPFQGDRESSPAGPALASPWRSREACERALLRSKKAKGGSARAADEAEGQEGEAFDERGGHSADGTGRWAPGLNGSRVRIGSWNLRWFPDGRAGRPGRHGGTDIGWMACVMAWMDVQALAVQEVVQHVRGRRAVLDLLALLDELTGGRWQAVFDDCPDDGRQHVGLLFDAKRVQASRLRTLESINPGASGCDRRLRPGFAGYLRFAGGADLHLITVHLDAGTTGRDFGSRQTSWSRLASAMGQLGDVERDSDVVLLGDFNTMGCRNCRPTVSAEDEIRGLVEAVSSGAHTMQRLAPRHPCSEYSSGRPALLDHVLVSAGMRELARPVAQVRGLCAELACAELRSTKAKALWRLSDHCPVVVELLDEDRD